METQTFTPEMLIDVQKDIARKLMNHLNYNDDFIENIIEKLINNQLSISRPSLYFAEESSSSNSSTQKTVKKKRQYTITPFVKAQREFNASHKDAVLAQIKSENVEPKKVAGTLSKRLAALWKESSEKAALTGEKTPQKNENTDSINDVSEEDADTFMIDLGEGEIQCYFKNDNELWSNGQHVANKISEDEYELI